MSYYVLARKWRPQTFDDVVGQEHITSTLKRALEKNRVAHAYIFSGTRGVGKTTIARILAKALNCEKGPTPNPCGECTSCKSILNGTNFDVIEIDGASNNSVDNIRELRENVAYSAMSGKNRIYIIDEVHMLSNSAFNALLKTLEEPPANVIFIFATTEPHKIPATILSRCQRYDFRRIDTENILKRLTYICTKENISFDASALMLISRKADGSMRDALSLLDQVYSFCMDHIGEKEVQSVLGVLSLDIYKDVIDSIINKNPSKAISIIQNILYEGYELQEFVEGLEEYLRDLLLTKIYDETNYQQLGYDKTIFNELRQISAQFSDGDLLRMAEIVKRTEQELKWSSMPRFLTEIMLLKLVYLDSTVSIEQLLKTLSNSSKEECDLSDKKKTVDKKEIENKLEKQERSFLKETKFTKDNTPIPPLSQNQKKEWRDFIDDLLVKRPKLGSLLSPASFILSSEHILELQFPSHCKFQFNEVSKKQYREEIIKFLEEYFNKKFDLRIVISNENKDFAPYPPTDLSLAINTEIEDEPTIKNVIEIFDGEFIE